METPAVLHLPPFPNVTRAHCPAAETQEVEPYSYSFPEYDFIPMELLMQFMPPQFWGYRNLQWPPPMGFWNYFWGWYWEFSNSLQWFFPYMFFDMRYGNVIHGTTSPDVDELTYDSTGIDINIEGTGYSSAWTVPSYTFESQTKDGTLLKFGEDVSGWDAAWAEMKAYTPDVGITSTRTDPGIYAQYRKNGDEDWVATNKRGYLSFDTSSLEGKTIVSATLKLYIEIVAALDDYETSRIVNVYTLAWDTLDASDWNGGTLVATFDENNLVVDAYYTITLTDTSTINKTGETQFEIAFAIDVDNTVITDPQDLYVEDGVYYSRGGGAFGWASGNAASNKPQLVVVAS